MEKDELPAFTGRWMELIDANLASRGVPVNGRLLSACSMFVEYAIGSTGVDAINNSKDFKIQFMLSASFKE
jgi:hypothetical protein